MEEYIFSRPDIELASYRYVHTSPKAMIFIAHGMAEHAQRYFDFAEFLFEHGFSIFLHDHRGHGKTKGIRGYFAKSDGWSKCVDDIHAHILSIKKTHPDTPIFLFGHSMGSFLSQEYLIRYSSHIDGAILCGSNGSPPPIAKVGTFIAKIEAKVRGADSPATFSEKISTFEFNKRFQPIRTTQDWLTRDKSEVDKFIADPLSGFPCTTQFWLDMLGGIDEICKPDRQKKVRSDIPLFIISGTMCAVGLFGQGVRNLINAYTQAGLFHLAYTLYPGGRHEILNEINKHEVYDDVLAWLNQQLETQQPEPS